MIRQACCLELPLSYILVGRLQLGRWTGRYYSYKSEWGATEAAGIELEAVKLASTVLQGNFELPKVVDTGDRG